MHYVSSMFWVEYAHTQKLIRDDEGNSSEGNEMHLHIWTFRVYRNTQQRELKLSFSPDAIHTKALLLL